MTALERALAGLASAERRREAAAAVARSMGGEDLLLFGPDPEIGVLLPAHGLPQTLVGPTLWRGFLNQCLEAGEHEGELPTKAGVAAPARGIADESRTVAVLVGGDVARADLSPLRPLLPLLGALFLNERRAQAADVHARAAYAAADRAKVLTEALQTMRGRLEKALAAAEQARTEARSRAQHAEELAEELGTQSSHLQDQAIELEIVNQELEVRTREAEAARASAMAASSAKSEFLANMSHELRTPINAILGYDELLEMEIAGPLTPGQRTYLERIRTSSRHLLRLIDDILDLAKVEARKLTVQHRLEGVAEVVAEAIALVGAGYEKRELSLTNQCIGSDARFLGDRDRVRQILLNLLSNAEKFSGRGAAVTITCGTSVRPDPLAEMTGDAPATFINVEDTGIGIAADKLRVVFQPFVQAEGGRTRTKGGTGLGLTISRHLARLQGGDLIVRSELGKGSCFTLLLPAGIPAAGSAAPTIPI